jgi:hypothetical protein
MRTRETVRKAGCLLLCYDMIQESVPLLAMPKGLELLDTLLIESRQILCEAADSSSRTKMAKNKLERDEKLRCGTCVTSRQHKPIR